MKKLHVPIMAVFLFFALLYSDCMAGEKWYTGGTLHSAGALDWQEAPYANKLATCGDIFYLALKKGMLKPSIAAGIKTTDDIKPFAIELTNKLDYAFRRDPDDEINRKLYINQSVASYSTLIMITGGWFKE
ncbi:MAG: hypothetical protein HY911_04295 [Desulfobacterales bacterium]|nr:hypothetical protein [Desulfobacterales bacterium]